MDDLILRRQAIYALSTITMYKGSIPYNTAVMRIEQLPSAQPEPIKINIEDFNKEDWERLKKEWANTPITVLSAEPKKGKWIKYGRGGRIYKCNKCGNYLDLDGVNAGRGSANFCPNCGADMRGEQDG